MRCIPQAFFRSPALFALVRVYVSISMDFKTQGNLEDLERRLNTQQHATLKRQSDLSINTRNKMQPSKEQKKKVLHRVPKMSPEKIKVKSNIRPFSAAQCYTEIL